MHIDILFLLQNNVDLTIFNHLSYRILEDAFVSMDFSITLENENVTYDYLIIDHMVALPILTEDAHIITNENFETSMDNVFAIGKINRSNVPINTQLLMILSYIEGSK